MGRGSGGRVCEVLIEEERENYMFHLFMLSWVGSWMCPEP